MKTLLIIGVAANMAACAGLGTNMMTNAAWAQPNREAMRFFNNFRHAHQEVRFDSQECDRNNAKKEINPDSRGQSWGQAANVPL